MNRRPKGYPASVKNPSQNTSRPASAEAESLGSILVDRDLLRAMQPDQSWISPGPDGDPIQPHQIQAASLDLRLSSEALRIRAGFLPGRAPLQERLEELTTSRLNLDAAPTPPSDSNGGAILERGLVYLVRLQEQLKLPPNVSASFNPRSSTGRCDVFCRVLVPGHPRFNEAPAGYCGELWLEIAPLSFPMRLKRGDRLCQLRLELGRAALTPDELRALYEHTPLCWNEEGPLDMNQVRFDGEGGLELHLGLKDRNPAGWKARDQTQVLEFGKEAAHRREDFFDPVYTDGPDARCILSPGGFYIFASSERVVIPPNHAAEMLPVDPGLGEMRNNYAGFFDNGFGWHPSEERQGTPAVLEVRAHDVPFLVDEGQAFFRLRYFRTGGVPDALYAQNRDGRSYAHQDLTLARAFR